MKKVFGLLGTLVAGVGAGVALGLLYAPEDGKTTREKLSFRLSKLKEKLQNIKNGNIEFTSVAKSQGQEVVRQTTEKAEEILKQLETMVNDLESEEKK